MNSVTVTLKVIRGKGEEFLQTVRSLRERLKQEDGFSKCTVYQDVTDEDTFNLIEEWHSQDHLENHLKSDLFSVLIGALKVLSEESEVTYRFATAKEGANVLDIK
jgi:quinol monooxygenase YgiN